MKHFVLTIFLLALFFQALGQTTIYSEVKITLNSVNEIQELATKGYAIDHYQGNWQEGIRFFVTPTELQSLQHEGYDLEITIPNYKEYYTRIQQEDRTANPNPAKSEGW